MKIVILEYINYYIDVKTSLCYTFFNTKIRMTKGEKAMAIKISIANQKGGVGKTTTALCLTDAMNHCGYKTLLIDLDPQCNSTSIYKAKMENENTILDIMNNSCAAKEAIQNTELGDIIPGDKLLPTIESQVNARMDRYIVLKKQLVDIEKDYDFIVMDTPPNLGVYMLNALSCSDGCICPIRAEKFAVDGLNLLLSTINDVRENVNPNIKIYGILLNAYDIRTSLGRNTWKVLPDMGEKYNFSVFETPIRVCQPVSDSQALQVSLFDAFPKSNAAVDFANVLKELLEKCNIGG